MWNPLINLTCHLETQQPNQCEIHDFSPSKPLMLSPWSGTALSKRLELFRHAISISHCMNSPWIVMGDFIGIRWSTVKIGRAAPNYIAMNGVSTNVLIVLVCLIYAYQVLHFSSSNISAGTNWNQRKLDGALVNAMFNFVFLTTTGCFFSHGLLDYLPVLVQNPEIKSPKSPFRFFNYWA